MPPSQIVIIGVVYSPLHCVGYFELVVLVQSLPCLLSLVCYQFCVSPLLREGPHFDYFPL